MNGYIVQFAEDLASCGIRYIFGVTGSGLSLQLISALEQIGIPYHPVAHEAAAALMAGACCRDGHTKAAAIGIKGPGFINFTPGILSNFYEGRPALTISEAYGPSDLPNKKHKRLDHKSVCLPIVKAYARANAPLHSLRNIFDFSSSEFPGPIHIDMPNEPEGTELVLQRQYNVDSEDKGVIDKALALIRKSNKPVVILGSMASRKLMQLDWNRLTVPMMTTASAKGVVDESYPYAGGVVTGEGKDISPEAMILEKADLIVAFGLRNTEVVKTKHYGAHVVMVDMISGDLHDGFDSALKIIGEDTQSTAETIYSELSRKEWGKDLVDVYRQSIDRELYKDRWLPPVVFRVIQETCLKDPLLVLDTGLFCSIGEIVWKARGPKNFCGSSNGRFMGTALPTAIGAAIEAPDQSVICIAGDGGIRPYLPEIKLAVQCNLPLIILLMADGQYGTIAASATNGGLSRKAFEINSFEWWKTVESMGCPAVKIENPNDLEKVLSRWKVNPGPLFIEMHFEPAKYVRMTNRLR